ncbi:MAG: choice-of-anchor D domain-containing protein [Ignavibacteria bacterium]|nr:choice-of-anchor D domain-containing protein [Ignavibacteria bacterium]
MQPGDKQDITFTFVKPDDGIYLDQIGIGDECQFVYRTQLKAEVASPIIEVDDFNYGTRAKNSRTPWTQLLVKNSGRVDLEVYGDDHLTALAATPEFEVISWTHRYPLIIKPGQNIALQVDYVPTTVGPSSANITFSSDAKVKDSISVLQAKAVEPGLIATPYDWKRKRIMKSYADTIYLENSGTAPVTIQSANWAVGSDATTFSVEPNLSVFAGVTLAAGERRAFDVKFDPTTTGPKTATINFVTNTPGISATSQLDGIGIIGRLKTSDIDFGTTDVDKKLNNRRQFKLESTSWQYEDSVTISDLAVQAGGTIKEDIVGLLYSTDGFRYNKAEHMFPLTLQPNQSLIFLDSAEFLAQRIGSASASISTVSDAEAEVTSIWTGNGIKSFVEDPRILVTMNNGSSCVGAPTSILGNIYSSGTTPFHIDSIIIEGDLLNEFSMKNPGDPRNIPTLLQGTNQIVEVLYTPSPLATAPSTVTLHVFGTNSISGSDVSYDTTVNFTGSGLRYTSTATIGTALPQSNMFKVNIGDKVTVPVTLIDPIDPNATVTKLVVTATYNKRLLVSLPNLFIAGGTLKISNATDSTKPTDLLGKVQFEITNPSGSITAAGKLADMVFAAYLPNGDPSTDITLDVQVVGSACAVVTSSPGKVTINETCAFDIRKVDGKGVSYYLSAVTPNPVGNKGADIEFSVGLKATTDLSLFTSSGSLVSIVAVGVLEPGAYSVKLPVDGLSSGSYILRMTSGQFTSEQQIIIAK